VSSFPHGPNAKPLNVPPAKLPSAKPLNVPPVNHRPHAVGWQPAHVPLLNVEVRHQHHPPRLLHRPVGEVTADT
jgi:hypothetical protein